MPELPYPHPTSRGARQTMLSTKRRDTGPEVRLRRELHRRGMRYRVDFPVRTGEVRVRPDVVFPRQRVAVFVDGCFWHRCPEHGQQPKANARYWGPKLDANVARDARVESALNDHGWSVLRVWEHEQVGAAADRIELLVRRERA